MTEEGVVGGLPSMDYEEVTPAGYIERDFVDHRQVFIGLHHRPGETNNPSSRKKLPKLSTSRVPKSFRWENGKKFVKHVDDSASDGEEQVEQLTHTAPASERVKFILGGDGEEEKQVLETPQLFTELEELFVHLDGNAEWKETARWYKYEEDVEEGGDRWSKPHVATLSLYSLFELRSSLTAGTVILDMEATSLNEISDSVLDNLITCNKLDKGFRQKVKETLLCKHRHHRSAGFRRNLSNIMSSRKSFNHSASKLTRNGTNGHLQDHNTGHTTPNGTAEHTDDHHTNPANIKLFRNYSQPAFPKLKLQPSIERSESLPQGAAGVGGGGHLIYQSPPSHDGEDETMENKTPGFLKRLPSNAEASNVLVGEVDFLEKPIAAFVRLSKSCIIDDLTEVPIPTRFVFVMLGPAVSQGRYHEIGRAISTLMADDVFHDVVYKAKCREDLIAGIDEFLEQVTVLPPGEWDPSIRLDPRLYNHHRPRRIAIEPKLEPPMEHSDKLSDGNDGGSISENSHSSTKTNRLFNGLSRDFDIWRSRKRDYKDGFSMRCIGTAIFIYLLLLGVISTIGENETGSTGGLIGTREHILALCISGLVFTVFSGQPLLVLSFALPLSLFDGILYNVCSDYNIDFLSFRMLIGLWAVVFLAIFVAVNLSSYLKFFTRFSLEIFVIVPALVLLCYGFVHMCYMIQSYAALPGTFSNQTCLCVQSYREPLNMSIPINNYTLPTNGTAIQTTVNTLNTTFNSTAVVTNTTSLTTPLTTVAMTTMRQQYRVKQKILHNIHFRDCIKTDMSLVGEACMHGVYPFTSILTVSSIVLFLFLTSFQHLGYLPKQVHQFFHNFAALIVVIALSASANQFNINIRYLSIPKSFAPNGIERTQWIVDPLVSNEAWIIVLAVIPAFILALMIFVEQQLSARQINNHYALLKKGHGYHLDLAVVCVGLFISSVFGLPFCVASIILSINNVYSLTTKSQADFIGCDTKIKEQRLSNLLTYVLITLTPTMRPILRYIPFPVLYGLLIVALFKTFAGTQFSERFTLLFMPKEKQPDIRYLRQVPLISVNIFTLSQVVLTVLLCVARGTLAVMVFPIVTILLIVMRALMERILPMRDILALDEPLPSFRCILRMCRKPRTELLKPESIEKGALLADESHEDVLPDINKDLDRVNISEELSKTAAWKQLTFAENSSPISNASPGDAVDGKKRRRKRSRTTKPGPNVGKDSPQSNPKSPPVENNELIEMNGHTIGLPIEDIEHRLQPWMTAKGVEEEETVNGRLSRQGSSDRAPPPHLTRQGTVDESQSNRSHSKHVSRQGSENKDSFKRQRSKDRGSLKNSSGKRYDSKRSHNKQEGRRNSSHKAPKIHHKQIVPLEETALPPWEQPYHSPPRKDFGLLHIPTDDNMVPDVDPACSVAQSSADNNSNSENVSPNETNETKTTLDDTISPIVTDRKDSILSDSPRHSNVGGDESGDASAELD